MIEENKINVLLGLQWGDEGKGKIIDYLTKNYDIIARFQGGPNAGHTIEFEDQKYVLHLIPSGIFHPDKKNLLGNGMVICPIAFKKEVEELAQKIPMEELKQRIIIANNAQIILPIHRLLDAANEISKGAEKIGSTLKGIGPTYTDKTSRIGIHIGDIRNQDFVKKYENLTKKHLVLGFVDTHLGIDRVSKILEKEQDLFFESIEFLKEFQNVNGPYWLDKQLRAGKKILAEGAQGTLLDVDHGNYPYVTSSNTICAGVCTGLGIAPNRIGKVYGLFKAYCTRVGMGPFPTELGGKKSDEWCATKKVEDENLKYPDAHINSKDPFLQGIALRKKGFEFGATTGRLRRTGWLDLPALQYACMINGVTDLIISKADVLSGFETVEVCERHAGRDEQLNEAVVLGKADAVNPFYKKFKGWGSLREIKIPGDLPKKIEVGGDLPEEFKNYLEYIQQETGIPIVLISTGPDRSEIVFQ